MTTGAKHRELAVERVPLKLVLLSILGLWACYYGLISARSYLVGMDYQAEMLWRRGLVAAAGAMFTVVLWLGIRLFDRHSLWVKVVAGLILALPVSFSIAAVNHVLFAPIQDRFLKDMGKEQGLDISRDENGELIIELNETMSGDEEDPLAQPYVIKLMGDAQPSRWQQITELAIGRYFMLVAWCALYFAMLAGERARGAERREGEFRQAAKAAELRSLRYQVNPHFLFNTLNSLSALILTGKNDRAEEMVQSIASFYRRSLTDDPSADLLLEEEIELQRNYLAIESVRFPERLKTKIDLPDELRDACVPGMILQPLIENSVKYAVAASTEPTTIEIKAREEFGRLVLSVSDDGPGEPTPENGNGNGSGPGHGIGLLNVRQRLEARFGEDAQITSGSKEDGYSTHIRIPLSYHDNR